MKKIIFLIGLVSLMSFSNKHFDQTTKKDLQEVTVYNCKIGQCKAKAKSTNKRCKHCVSNSGDSYCWQHN